MHTLRTRTRQMMNGRTIIERVKEPKLLRLSGYAARPMSRE